MSEIAALQTASIDSSAMRVMVRAGKGHKDRYTLLSQAALAALRAYWRAYRPADSSGWLFPSRGPTGHVTRASIQQAFARAAAAVPIGAPVSIHTLRHCFATHLLEDGFRRYGDPYAQDHGLFSEQLQALRAIQRSCARAVVPIRFNV